MASQIFFIPGRHKRSRALQMVQASTIFVYVVDRDLNSNARNTYMSSSIIHAKPNLQEVVHLVESNFHGEYGRGHIIETISAGQVVIE